jgi:predicted enzyme related to lactoylglutathione lyase
MANAIKLIVFPVKDLEKAKNFYTTYLGTEPYADSAYYVGYRMDGPEVGLDPNGTAVVSYVDTDDIEASIKSLQDAGAEVVMGSKDVGGGLLVAQVKDTDGNVVGFRQQPK